MIPKTLLTIFSLCVALLLTQPAKAERRWAYEYLDICEPSSSDWPICEAYIKGFLDGINRFAKDANASKRFCLPEDVRPEQVAKAFKAFAENTHFSFFAMEGALYIALSVKFPCRVP